MDRSLTVRARLARAVTSAAGVLGALGCWLGAAGPAAAHGEITGVRDVVQDYGVLLFLVATVLIGAGVLAWVTLSPQPDEPPDQADAPAAAPPPEPAAQPAVQEPAAPPGAARRA